MAPARMNLMFDVYVWLSVTAPAYVLEVWSKKLFSTDIVFWTSK